MCLAQSDGALDHCLLEGLAEESWQMNKDKWTKIVGAFTIIGAIAALLVVPEVRRFIGLDSQAAPQIITQSSEPSTTTLNDSKLKSTSKEYNVALGKPVTITTNGADDPCPDCGRNLSSVTDGSLSEGGFTGFKNNNYGELLIVKITINLQGKYHITKIRYNMGAVQRCENWNADLMITPFGSTITNLGSGRSTAWTEMTGDSITSSITITFQKTRRTFETDWIFIGEIEVIGTDAL